MPRVGECPRGELAEHAQSATDILAKVCGDNLISVMLRGTAARNATISSSSDLDLVVLTNTPLAAEPEFTLPNAPHIPVDIYATTNSAFLNERHEGWLRFNLCHAGIIIWGEDVLKTLPVPVLNQDAIGHMRDLDAWYSAWPTYFDEEETESDKKDLCAWLMKRLVRGAFETVMFKEMAYTRDIYPCVETTIKHHPQFEPALVRAAELVIEPTADKSEIEAVAADCYELLKAEQAGLV
jgi:hypothetical protein